MSYPTGMGAVTGSHYQNVAAQMQAYLNNSNGGGGSGGRGYAPRPVQDHFRQFQPSMGFANASHVVQNSAQMLGINPMITNDIGAFGRLFMNNLLSR